MNSLDDDERNWMCELTDEELDMAMKEMRDMDEKEYQRLVLESMLKSTDPANGLQTTKPRPFDAASARAIASNNKSGQLSRELSNVEARIRDAAYDKATQVECGDLFPETVQELRSRGFTVTVKKNTFLDDPRLYYTSESFAATTYYIISWKVEELQ